MSEETSGVVREWRARVAEGAVVLDGFHALKHALRFDAPLFRVLALDPDQVRELARELAPDLVDRLGPLVVRVPEATLRALVPRVHPTGVVALAERPDPVENLTALGLLTRVAPLVVLDQPRHLGNLGAVIRLAAGMDVAGVVTTGSADPWHPGAVRAGAGLHFATRVERVEPEELPSGPRWVLDPEGEDLRDVRIPAEALLVFGSERHGVSPELRAGADRLLALPMRPQVSSYNLATSVAMTLYHWRLGEP
ncbi:RNA methyltransferase [Streptomyces sp. NPDC005438]|uniref:TrmH family RNA methyltransferase n=1 Tax=Streptomyces sp. NPDC005438 TaxID=3156880 RepID=UPI0033AB4710